MKGEQLEVWFLLDFYRNTDIYFSVESCTWSSSFILAFVWDLFVAF